MEGTESTHNTKVSDSAYSHSCSNSQSQRSGSSKSRHSGSHSSGSSGYGAKTLVDTTANVLQLSAKKGKERKKKLKGAPTTEAATKINEPLLVSQTDVGDENIVYQLPEMLIAKDEVLTIENTSDVVEIIETMDQEVQSGDTDAQTVEGGKSHVPTVIGVTIEPPKDPMLATIQESNKQEKIVTEDGFCCIISMQDGVVLYTTPSITDSLGFPRDLWLGRSFIDFVHPLHRNTFAAQITSGVAAPFYDQKADGPQKENKNCIYVLLRQYRGLKTSGYSVTRKAVIYEPYRLLITFREAPEEQCINAHGIISARNRMLLVVSATPLKSFYKG